MREVKLVIETKKNYPDFKLPGWILGCHLFAESISCTLPNFFRFDIPINSSLQTIGKKMEKIKA